MAFSHWEREFATQNRDASRAFSYSVVAVWPEEALTRSVDSDGSAAPVGNEKRWLR